MTHKSGGGSRQGQSIFQSFWVSRGSGLSGTLTHPDISTNVLGVLFIRNLFVEFESLFHTVMDGSLCQCWLYCWPGRLEGGCRQTWHMWRYRPLLTRQYVMDGFQSVSSITVSTVPPSMFQQNTWEEARTPEPESSHTCVCWDALPSRRCYCEATSQVIVGVGENIAWNTVTRISWMYSSVVF